MMPQVIRLTEDEERAARADGKWCAVCHKTYGDEDRSDLHVYPDGCTAHDGCRWSEQGSDTAHWHNKTTLCERCGERPPTTDVGGWICDPCAREYPVTNDRPREHELNLMNERKR